MPDNLKSSYQLADSGYDVYLNDAHKQVSRGILNSLLPLLVMSGVRIVMALLCVPTFKFIE